MTITKINPIDGAEMVLVPGGTFTMGSPDYVGAGNEHPAHKVTLSEYWIYKYEITVAQYCKFCVSTSHILPNFPNGYSWEGKSSWDDIALQKHPIVNVTWDDCNSYANWAGVNLPTEAQWEYAARGPQGNNYPWGGTATASDPENGWDQNKCANYNNSYDVGKSTWPVGSFPAGVSWCGTHDMAGNVWEWCSDWLGNYYKNSKANNPIGRKKGTLHVLRGGSWGNWGGDYAYFDRSAFRFIYYPDYYIGVVGFRCASPRP